MPKMKRKNTKISRVIAKRGLIIVHTGDGKGKTSAALGIMLRSLIHGFNVAMVQFIKGKWKTAEQKLTQLFPERLEIFTMGDGFTWNTKNKKQDIKSAKLAWSKCIELVSSGRYDLIVLDEINYVLDYGFLKVNDVLRVIKNKPDNLHIILTGRNAKKSIIKAADLVTEMKEIKHPFRKGIIAQRGIEF